MSNTEPNKIYLNDSEGLLSFIDALVPHTEIKINSTSNTNGHIYHFFTKTPNNMLFFIAKNKSLDIPPNIKLNLESLDDNSYGIESIELNITPVVAERAGTDVSTESKLKQAGKEVEADEVEVDEEKEAEQIIDKHTDDEQLEQMIDEIEEEEDTIFITKTAWELTYTKDELIESYISQVQDYNSSKRINVSIDSLTRDADAIIDLIEKYKLEDDVFNKDVISYDPEFKPLLNKLLNGDFNNCYITPIIYDKKKFYTDSSVEGLLAEKKEELALSLIHI